MGKNQVLFITTEEDEHLIVSFAISTGGPGEVRSLTLLRDVKWESVLPPNERGVSVSDESEEPMSVQDPEPLLQSLRWEAGIVHLSCQKDREYELDVSGVDQEEVAEAQRLLRAMNHDERFHLDLESGPN